MKNLAVKSIFKSVLQGKRFFVDYWFVKRGWTRQNAEFKLDVVDDKLLLNYNTLDFQHYKYSR